MQRGKLNLVVDGFHGSSGKGKIATYLADRDKPPFLLSTNMPNAGHTAVKGQVTFISKVLPTPACLNSPAYLPKLVLGGSSSFFLDRLFLEIEQCELDPRQVLIHPRAGVVLPEHAARERDTLDGPKSVASTMQGCATFMSDKILRRPGVKLAKDYRELQHMIFDGNLPVFLTNVLNAGETALGEVSQGIGLDILHGSHYPNCTSRSCTPMQFLSDFGLTHKHVGDIYLNIRPFPIRVGNVVEDGKTVGYSGDFYEDAKEITWQELGTRAGMPQEEIDKLLTNEMTTVTKRLRRVFEFSEEGLINAVVVSGANKISLNFAQYIDWGAAGLKGGPEAFELLPERVKAFVKRIEDRTGIPVTLIGTGPRNEEIIDREGPMAPDSRFAGGRL